LRGLLKGSLAGALMAAMLGLCPAQALPPSFDQIHWHRSVALGTPNHGTLIRGVQLPSQGPDWFTWELTRVRSPNPPWRRWATDRLISTLLTVLHDYGVAHPSAPRVGIADLSRRHGGDFGPEFGGGLGHASHQNGLDVDVLYPRRDHRELVAYYPSQVDERLSQDLVNRFVRAGAKYVFVGPHLRLKGPRRKVQRLIYHDEHMHVRIPAAGL
jgi:murein endopeptidase